MREKKRGTYSLFSSGEGGKFFKLTKYEYERSEYEYGVNLKNFTTEPDENQGGNAEPRDEQIASEVRNSLDQPVNLCTAPRTEVPLDSLKLIRRH